MYDKTTNIYVLVTFCFDSWRRPWGGHRTFTLLVIGWPTFPPPSPWRAQAIRLASARWSFPCSNLLGFGFLPSLSHPRPSSSEAWTSSPTGSACFASVRRHLSRCLTKEERPPSTPGHPVTSTTRRPRFAPSLRWVQTPLRVTYILFFTRFFIFTADSLEEPYHPCRDRHMTSSSMASRHP